MSFARSTVSTAPTVLSDYQYLADVYPDGSPAIPTNSIELYLRFEDAGHHYVVRFVGPGGQLVKVDQSGSHVLREFVLALPPYEWSTIRLVAVGSVLQGFAKDPEAVECMFFHYEDTDSPILHGSVGVGVRTGLDISRARFDDVLVALTEESVAVGAASPMGMMPPPVLWVGPNPVGPTTRVRFSLPAEDLVRLVVYDVRGRRVATLFEGVAVQGPHVLSWDGRDARGLVLGSGCYVGALEVAGHRAVAKLLIVR